MHISRTLHVVQVGWDTALLQTDAPSDSAQRQQLYAQLLEARRPGSRMTIVVLGAPSGSTSKQLGPIAIEPIAGRWRGPAGLFSVLKRLHAKHPISVITPQSPLEEGWASLAFARGRIPVVVQVHFDFLSDLALPGGSQLRQALGRARRCLALRLLPRFAAVRTVASDMACQLLERGARSAKSIAVPIMDLDELLALRLEQIRPGVLFVGRLAPEKNLNLWLAVALRVAAARSDVHFDIVGDGPQKPSLEAQVRHLGLSDRVIFHGARPRTALANDYAEASVLLLTSDHEGFGRVLVEAMAAGVAVVSTRTAGAREVLDDGAVGVLAPIGDADALAAGVVRLLADVPYRAALVDAGRRRVAKRYRPETLAAQWVDMLIEVAEQGNARPLK